MCDVCAAHGDRAAVGVDVDAQGSSLREDKLLAGGACRFGAEIRQEINHRGRTSVPLKPGPYE